MKRKILLLVTFLALAFSLNSANALQLELDDWYFDPAGGTAISSSAISDIDYLQMSGVNLIQGEGLTFDMAGAYDTSTFQDDHTAAIWSANVLSFFGSNYELTMTLEAEGFFTPLSGNENDITFTSATLSIYLDTTGDYGTLTTDADLYGAGEGTDGLLIATFVLVTGEGEWNTVDENGQTDIDFISSSILSGYFYDKDGVDLSTYAANVTAVTTATNTIRTFDTLADEAAYLAEFRNDSFLSTIGTTEEFFTDSEGGFDMGVVPEPTTIVLFGFGLLGLAGIGRRKVR